MNLRNSGLAPLLSGLPTVGNPDATDQPSSDPDARIMRGQLTLGGAPILMASDGGGLILVLSVGSAASLSQQRNNSAQAVLTEEKSTPEHHADTTPTSGLPHKRISGGKKQALTAFFFRYTTSIRTDFRNRRGPGARLGRRISLEIVV